MLSSRQLRTLVQTEVKRLKEAQQSAWEPDRQQFSDEMIMAFDAFKDALWDWTDQLEVDESIKESLIGKMMNMIESESHMLFHELQQETDR
jgi:hypothetical protein